MSKTIDERIVSLKFDNAQFESATKESMSTLDKLKQALKFDKSKDSLRELGETANAIDLQGLNDAIDVVNRRFSALGIAGSAIIRNLASKATDYVTKIVGAVPSMIWEGGWRRAENIEQARFQIEGLNKVWNEFSEGFTKGMTKEDTIFYWVDEAVTDTAYSLDEAAKVASQLAASGMDAGEDMGKALKAISGTAAMTGRSYEDIGHIFTKVAGNGKAMGDTWQEMSVRGLNGAAEVAKYMNGVNDGTIQATDSMKEYIRAVTGGQEVTEQFIRDPAVTKEGLVTWEVFYEAMASSFAEHAKEANDTYSGALANVRAAFARLGADVQEVRLEKLKNMFNAIRPAINATRWALMPLTAAFNKLSYVSSTKTAIRIAKISNALERFFKPRGQEVKNRWTTEFENMKKVTKETMAAIENGEKVTMKDFRKRLKEASKSVEETADAAEKSETKFGKFRNRLAEIATSIKESAANSKALQHLASAFRNLGSAMKSGVKNFFHGFIEFGKQLKNTAGFQNLTSQLKALWAILKHFASERIEGFATFIDKVAGIKMKGNFIENAATLFGKLAGHLANFIQHLREGVVNLHGFTAGFKPLQKIHFDGSGLETFVGILKKIKDIFMDLFGNKAKETIEAPSFKDWNLEEFANNMKKFADGMEAVDWERLISIAKKIGVMVIELQALWALKETVSNLQGLSGAFEYGVRHFFNLPSNVKTRNARNIAVSIAIMAGALYLISKIPPEDMKRSIITLGLMMTGMAILAKIFNGPAQEVAAGASKADKVSGQLKGYREFGRIAGMFLAIGASMLLIASAMKIISTIEPKQLAKAAGTIIGMITVMTIVGKVLNGTTLQLGGLIAMAFAINLLVVPLAILGKMKITTLAQGVAIIGILMGLMSYFAKYVGGFKGAAGAAVILALATAVDLLVAPLAILALLPLNPALKAVGILGMIFTELMAATYILSTGNAAKGAAVILALAGAIDIMIPVITLLALLPIKKAWKAVGLLGAMIGELTAAIVIAGMSPNAVQGGATILAIAGAIDIMIPALIALALAPVKRAWNAVAMLTAIFTAMTVLMHQMKARQIGAGATNMKKVAMALAIAAGALWLVALIPAGKLLKSMVSLTLVFTAITQATKGAAKAKIGALMIGIVLAEIVAAFAILEKVAPEGILQNAIGMATAVGAIGGILALFAELEVQVTEAVNGALAFSAGFGIIVGAIFGVTLAIGALLDKFDGLQAKLEKGVAAMALIGEAIGNFVGGIVGGFTATASKGIEALGKSLAKFGIYIMPFVTSVKRFNDKALQGVKDLAEAVAILMGIQLGSAAGQVGTTFFSGLNQFLGGEKVTLISKLEEFADALVAFANKLKDLSPQGIAKVKVATEMLKTLSEASYSNTGLLAALSTGSDSESYGNIGTNLAKIGEGITNMSYSLNFIPDGVADKVKILGDIFDALSKAPTGEGGLFAELTNGSTDYSQVATNMQSLGQGVTAMSYAINFIPDGVEDKATILGKIFEALGKADVADGGLLDVLRGNVDFSQFETNLRNIGKGLMGFDEETAGLKTGGLNNKIESLGEILTTMSNAPDTYGGLVSWIIGGTKFGTLANNMRQLGQGLVDFDEATQDLKTGGLNNKINVLADFFAVMSEAPDTYGGVWGFLTGGTNFTSLGTSLTNLGYGLAGFDEGTKGMQTAGLTNKAQALADVLTALNSAPETYGGVFSWFTGGTDFTTLSKNLEELSVGLLIFVNRLATMPEDMGGRIEIFTRLLEGLNSVEIDTNRGFIGWLSGTTTLGDLSDNLGGLGEGFGDFANALAAADFKNVSAMTSLLPNLANGLTAWNDNNVLGNMTSLTTNLPSFGDALSDFYSKIKDLTGADVDTIISDIERLSSVAKDVNLSGFNKAGSTASTNISKGFNAGGKTFTATIKSLMSSGVKAVTSYGKNYKNAAQTLMNNLVVGISSSKPRVAAIAGTVVSSFSTGITSRTSTARSAGAQLARAAANGAEGVSLFSVGYYVVKGFANGIKNYTYFARAAARAMVKEAKEAADREADSASPSKEFIKRGRWVAQGYAIGITKDTPLVGNAAAGMVKDALGLADRMSAAINDNVDAQPVITPILDTSNIQRGANAISSLMSSNRAMSMSARISGDLATTLQNGNKDPMEGIAKRLDKVADSMKTQPITNNITVNGAENPEAFADRFVRKLKLNLRTT